MELVIAIYNALRDEGQIGTLREYLEANRGRVNFDFLLDDTVRLYDSVNITRLLLELGADPNSYRNPRDREHGFSLLNHAIIRGRNEIAEALIRGGADVNAHLAFENVNFVDSPLLIAAYRGNTNIVRILLEHDADVSFVGGPNGKSALQNAQENNYSPEINALIINAAGPAKNVPPLPPAPVAARPNTRNHRRATRRRKARRTTRRNRRNRRS